MLILKFCIALAAAVIASRRADREDEDEDACRDPHCDICRYYKAHQL